LARTFVKILMSEKCQIETSRLTQLMIGNTITSEWSPRGFI
jgi:hypothetical protein